MELVLFLLLHLTFMAVSYLLHYQLPILISFRVGALPFSGLLRDLSAFRGMSSDRVNTICWTDLTVHRVASSSRWLATASAESSSPAAVPLDPKLSKIVDDISSLTLLQAADLVTVLKVSAVAL